MYHEIDTVKLLTIMLVLDLDAKTLARKAEIAETTACKVMCGLGKLSTRTLERIAEALGVDEEMLILSPRRCRNED